MSLPRGAAVICLGESGLTVARQVAAALPGASLHGLARRVADRADVAFDDTTGHVASLFAAGIPVVGVCAAGILIRAVAPLLADKGREGAVVAVAEDGSAVVPLLGGHRGANAIARRCAGELGVPACVTTAGDARYRIALDEPPPGWRLADPAAAKDVMAAMLAGEKVALTVDAGDASWLSAGGYPFASRGSRTVRVTDRAQGGGDLVMFPPVLAVGAGCERGCEPGELIGLVRRVMADAGLAGGAVACIASIDLKCGEAAMLALADAFDVPFVTFGAGRLERETPRLVNPSAAVFRAVGCHGVAEAAALAAAGGDGRLVVAKTKSRRATCAVARAANGIDADSAGKKPGRLTLVGLGPGAAELRTPESSREIAAATDVVGYGYYLDLAGPLVRNKALHAFALGQETARCRAALDLAGRGRRVVLLCSGDPGIYAMASLVHQLLDEEPAAAWRGVGIDLVPGVSALQLAAARAGAPIGHDFCAISLSDLLTPREAILRRIEAAAEGDFVIAFYNPASRRRRDLLDEARAVLLRFRAPATPVTVGRMLGRAGETTVHTTLDELDAGQVDMMSVVLVGSSATRRYRHRGREAVYTPRGYPAAGASSRGSA